MQTTLTQNENGSDAPTDDHPPIPDGLDYDSWDEIPQIVRNNIENSDGVVRDSFADYAAEQLDDAEARYVAHLESEGLGDFRGFDASEAGL